MHDVETSHYVCSCAARIQEAGASTAPTGERFSLPQVLASCIPILPGVPAVVLLLPGAGDQLCNGFPQTRTRQ